MCLTPALCLFQESEPISRYLHAEIATELRQRLAKMGMDMLLKMVGTWLRMEVKLVFLQKLFSWVNNMAKERTFLLTTTPTLFPVDSNIKLSLLEPAAGCQVSFSNTGLRLPGHCAAPELAERRCILCVPFNKILSKAWAR